MSLGQSLKQIFFLALILIGLVSYNLISAQWIGPTATAPANNATTSINVGGVYQRKIGTPADLGAVRMRAGLYCDASGLNCFTAPAMAGGGSTGLTQLTSGAGIALSPATITSTGTVNIDPNYTQRRIAATCPAGQSIRQVNIDGSVVCQNTVATCYMEGLAYTEGSGCFVDIGSSGGSGAIQTYLSCGSDGTWNTESYSSLESNPASKYRGCP